MCKQIFPINNEKLLYRSVELTHFPIEIGIYYDLYAFYLLNWRVKNNAFPAIFYPPVSMLSPSWIQTLDLSIISRVFGATSSSITTFSIIPLSITVNKMRYSALRYSAFGIQHKGFICDTKNDDIQHK